ncbi:MAG: EscU/YscU/HrcU family type III secretion system export apparatus switch protein [Oleiphilaceae bacterium]|nr:EscU/YscU/HrcU family type III secretion system export apparatus switch protein [Oleiphilaceae bacterium]
MEKKFEASKQRIKRARQEGQVSKSQDALKLAGLVAAFEIANLYYIDLLHAIEYLFVLPTHLQHLPFTQALERVAIYALGLTFTLCLGTMLIIALVKIAFTWLQTGFVFSTAPLKGGFSRLSPAKQIAQMFSLNKLWDIFAALLKLSLLILLGLFLFWAHFDDLLGLTRAQAHQVWLGLHAIFLSFERSLLIALIALAVLDVVMQNRFYRRRLKMTEQEVKQERKERDGDPHIKSKRRSLAQQFLLEPDPPNIKQVLNADALVVNPTHVAVALSYKPDESPLPLVLYTAADDEAQTCIKLAQEHHIPVIRYLWLARTLYAECQPGQCIPRETIHAAAALFKTIKTLQQEPPEGDGIVEMD